MIPRGRSRVTRILVAVAAASFVLLFTGVVSWTRDETSGPIASAFASVIRGAFFASVLAIIGGAFIANFALDIPFFTFLQRIREVVPLTDVWVGLIKAPVFGLIVGLAGCYQGMQVSGNAEEVGKRTTMAVVQAIFMVIVLDAFFAIFFTEIGWG